MKKKPSRRSSSRYPALDPKLNLKTRAKLLDADYLDKLSDTELQWYNDFHNEFTHADFKTNINEGRKRIHKKKKVEHEKNRHLKKLIIDFLANIKVFITILNESQITNTARSKFKKSVNKFKKQLKTQIKKEFTYIADTYKQQSEYANNHRNMDILSRQEAMGMAKSLDQLPERLLSKINVEDEILEKIDYERRGILNDEND